MPPTRADIEQAPIPTFLCIVLNIPKLHITSPLPDHSGVELCTEDVHRSVAAGDGQLSSI